jgi:uncharacterized protein YndB with AHSA1/START domain
MDAAPQAVYRALLDPHAVAVWRVPRGMSCEVHQFDPQVGGTFRISLSYDAPDRTGKSAAHTDTYRGHFVELVPAERVVEVLEFETDDRQLRGLMTLTTSIEAANGGTEVVIVHEGIPDGVRKEDNELGTRMALENLAQVVEGVRGSSNGR